MGPSVDASALPDPVARLCVTLGTIAGVEAITLGGSRAAGTAGARSDWDVGVYYRGTLDLSALGDYPAALSQSGARRWPRHARFSLAHARMRAERGDVIGTLGQAARRSSSTLTGWCASAGSGS